VDQPSKVQQFDNPTEDYVDNLYRITRHNLTMITQYQIFARIFIKFTLEEPASLSVNR